ncbi:MAG TPA: hypothetical protein VHR16_04375, partial [Candidatus Limnocylindrales bacterium]|nr:hypothetical protein [Candidatus Limnocylindrales bacterium]
TSSASATAGDAVDEGLPELAMGVGTGVGSCTVAAGDATVTAGDVAAGDVDAVRASQPTASSAATTASVRMPVARTSRVPVSVRA